MRVECSIRFFQVEEGGDGDSTVILADIEKSDEGTTKITFSDKSNSNSNSNSHSRLKNNNEILNSNEKVEFEVEEVFAPSANMNHICSYGFQNHFEYLLNGRNCSFIAFGETDCGVKQSFEGLVDYSSETLLNLLKSSNRKNIKYKLGIQFIEIQNDSLLDLLINNNQKQSKQQQNQNQRKFEQRNNDDTDCDDFEIDDDDDDDDNMYDVTVSSPTITLNASKQVGFHVDAASTHWIENIEMFQKLFEQGKKRQSLPSSNAHTMILFRLRQIFTLQNNFCLFSNLAIFQINGIETLRFPRNSTPIHGENNNNIINNKDVSNNPIKAFDRLIKLAALHNSKLNQNQNSINENQNHLKINKNNNNNNSSNNNKKNKSNAKEDRQQMNANLNDGKGDIRIEPIENFIGLPDYSSSSLTLLLKDAIGGNCVTKCLACIKPDDPHASIFTLNRCKNLRQITNYPIINDSNAKTLLSHFHSNILKLNERIHEYQRQFEKLTNCAVNDNEKYEQLWSRYNETLSEIEKLRENIVQVESQKLQVSRALIDVYSKYSPSLSSSLPSTSPSTTKMTAMAKKEDVQELLALLSQERNKVEILVKDKHDLEIELRALQQNLQKTKKELNSVNLIKENTQIELIALKSHNARNGIISNNNNNNNNHHDNFEMSENQDVPVGEMQKLMRRVQEVEFQLSLSKSKEAELATSKERAESQFNQMMARNKQKLLQFVKEIEEMKQKVRENDPSANAYQQVLVDNIVEEIIKTHQTREENISIELKKERQNFKKAEDMNLGLFNAYRTLRYQIESLMMTISNHIPDIIRAKISNKLNFKSEIQLRDYLLNSNNNSLINVNMNAAVVDNDNDNNNNNIGNSKSSMMITKLQNQIQQQDEKIQMLLLQQQQSNQMQKDALDDERNNSKSSSSSSWQEKMKKIVAREQKKWEEERATLLTRVHIAEEQVAILSKQQILLKKQ